MSESGAVFLVLGTCGSYYCNGLHPVAPCTSRQRAESLIEAGVQGYEALRVVEMRPDRVEVVTTGDLGNGCA